MLRTTVGVGASVLGLLLGSAPATGQEPAYFSLIGYDDLKARLGPATPTGAGVTVTQVEALAGTNAYLPDPAAFPGQTITDRTGGGAVSGHATTVGSIFYGDSSIAPGIPQVNAYRVSDPTLAGDWFGDGYLRVGTPFAPRVDTGRVQNHSWIDMTAANDPVAVEVLRRLDYAVARDNVVVVVAVNNGTGSVPALLGNGYNSIAVGLTNGNSSVGPTTTDGAGRSKPDIVSPSGETSFAAPVVSAAAALLVQTAAGKADPAEAAAAGRAETIKAALLSGATTSQFAGLAVPWHRTDNGSFVEPLDRRFGAGQLNINNSHLILSAPRQNGTDRLPDALAGWDFGTFTAAGQTFRYLIDAPGGATASTLSVTVTWLRQVPQAGAGFTTETATLADIELRVSQTDADRNPGPVVDSSLSPVDNVQHTRTDLIPGSHYAMEVSLAAFPLGQSSSDFAVAWQVTTTPVPEPAAGGLVAAAAGLAALARRRSSPRPGAGPCCSDRAA